VKRNLQADMMIECERRDKSDEIRSFPERVTSLSLLRQEADVSQHILHFSVGELPSPRMHRAEDDAVFDRTQ
jgi:hypothetical protein